MTELAALNNAQFAGYLSRVAPRKLTGKFENSGMVFL
jgi:hypothetical protein